MGSNHYSSWHCIKWSVQRLSYGVCEDACIQPKHAAAKTLKKKISQGYLRLFTIHLQIFRIYFSWNTYRKFYFLSFDTDWKLDISCRDWGVWEQSAKESKKVLNGRVSRGMKKTTCIHIQTLTQHCSFSTPVCSVYQGKH